MPHCLTIRPITFINGNINLPGSKSISNRALLLAALAHGKTTLFNLLDSDDVTYMLNALKLLGVTYFLSADCNTCEVIGNDGLFQNYHAKEIFLGNAGTVMRPLTAILSLGKQEIILTGEARMKERPIGHLIQALCQGGAKIDYLEQKKYPPIKLYGGFQGGVITINGSISSQFLSALLMAAPLASQNTYIKITNKLVSKPYIDITINLMRSFGIMINHSENYQYFFVKGQQKYLSPGKYFIEGDASSASYFLAAAAIKGGTVKVSGIGQHSIQGDIYFAKVLEKMGALITWNNNYISCTKGELNAIEMDMNNIPDAAMTVAILGLFAKGQTVIRNIHNWRLKETDRLNAMAKELINLGATVKEGYDYIIIHPCEKLKQVTINTYNDHRIAMCFSLIALADISVTISNPGCTSKTFPNYFQELKKISSH